MNHTCCLQVEAAGEKVEAALQRAFEGISEYSQQHDPTKSRPVLIYDPVNTAVWIKLDKKSQVGLFVLFSNSLVHYIQQHDSMKSRPVLVYEPVNTAVWINLDKTSQVTLCWFLTHCAPHSAA